VGGGFFCLGCGTAGAANLVRNVLLFLPLGFFLHALHPRVLHVGLLGAAVSAGVELGQHFIPGRNPLLVDLLANGAGATLGGFLAATLPSWVRPTGKGRRIAALVSSALAAAAASLPAFLLVPAPPQTELWAQWNPRIAGGRAYPGPVVEARLGIHPLPPGPLPEELPFRGSFLLGDTLVVVMEAAAPELAPGGLFRVLSAADGREAVTLLVEGEGVILSLPYRADRAGLARPRIRVPGALSGVEPGATARLSAVLGAGGEVLFTSPAGAWWLPGIDPSMGWSLLYFPPGTGGGARALLGFLWCGALLFAPLYWGIGRGRWAAAGVVLAGLALTPFLVAHLAPLPPAGWAGALLGATTGWWAGRSSPGLVRGGSDATHPLPSPQSVGRLRCRKLRRPAP